MQPMADVMQSVAEWASKIPFQRAIDRNLTEIELLLSDGFTYQALADSLADQGFALPDNKRVSVAYLGGAISRARKKVRNGKRMSGQPFITSRVEPASQPEPARTQQPNNTQSVDVRRPISTSFTGEAPPAPRGLAGLAINRKKGPDHEK